MNLQRIVQSVIGILLATVLGTGSILLISQLALRQAVMRLEAVQSVENILVVARGQKVIPPAKELQAAINQLAVLWGRRPGSSIINQMQQETTLLLQSAEVSSSSGEHSLTLLEHTRQLGSQGFENVARINHTATKIIAVGFGLIAIIVLVGTQVVYWGVVMPLIKLQTKVSHHIMINASGSRNNSLGARHDEIRDIENTLKIMSRKKALIRQQNSSR